jgi:uncharacterized protein YkwD
MRSCPNCGRANAQLARQCWSCGRALSAPDDPAGLAAGRANPPAPSRPGTASAASGGTSERAVLGRYFNESRGVTKDESATIRLPDSPPVQIRPRAWWDRQVRWSEEVRATPERIRRPPPPPVRPSQPARGAPAVPAVRTQQPVRISTAPQEAPAPAAQPAAPAPSPRFAPRFSRASLVTAALLAFLLAVIVFALLPTRVRRGGDTASQTSTGAPAGQVDRSETVGSNTGDAGGRGDRKSGAASGSPSERLIARINEARAAQGRPALVPDKDLALVAAAHVDEMIGRGHLYHTPTDTLARRVTSWKVLAESIGVGPDVKSLFDALMGSEADRRNLLDPSFRHIGVDASRRGDRLWVTVMFSDDRDPGTPLN